MATGRKTQTRRPVKAGKPCRYKVGHDYAVQPGYGREGIARLKVLSVREEICGDISYTDARAEGFKTTAEFKRYFVRLHDKAWIKRELIDLVSVYDDKQSIVDWILLERFERRHAFKPVHVITFELLRDEPRYLATQRDILSGRADDGEYTLQRHRAIDELEVVDEITPARFAKKAEEQRASFKRDLEIGRQQQRNARRDRLFRAA